MNKILFIGNKSPLFADVAVNKDTLDLFYKGYKGSVKISCASTMKLLADNNIDCKLIDPINVSENLREYMPTHVIVNEFFLTPKELRNYTEEFINIKWVILKHGEIPSTAVDSNLINWLIEYLKIDNVTVASVSPRTFNDFKIIARSISLENKVKLLPTLHEIIVNTDKRRSVKSGIIDVGCFGVIRFLKNQLVQAIAAIEYANRKNIKLRYHITINPPHERNPGPYDIEGFGQILKNIRELFSSLDKNRFELIEHRWTSRDMFLDLVKEMDLGLNLSLSESFNLVSTDFVFNNVPVIGSKEIFWLPKECIADNTDTESIVSVMLDIMENYEKKNIYEKTIKNLIEWNNQALNHWINL